jgi:hypothetical protein
MTWWERSSSRARKPEARSQKPEEKAEVRRQKAEVKAKAAAVPVILRKRRSDLDVAKKVGATEGSPNGRLGLAGWGTRAGGGILPF